jgi:hypothetical protein
MTDDYEQRIGNVKETSRDTFNLLLPGGPTENLIPIAGLWDEI